MGAVDIGFWDYPDTRPGYRDLRPIADDKEVLRNPHKGWYWHYIDNGYGRGNYREQHDPKDHCLDFPGLNHLYLRFDWGDIEAQEGVFDWSYLDNIMEEWGAYGYRFSLRACTYEASPEGSLAFATPKWVFDAGAAYTIQQGGAYEPDYGDPVFLEKLEGFMREYGRKFNGDPRIETVDIGSFGTWGEGHTGAGSDRVYPYQVMKAHLDLHVKYFPDTFLLFNDDFLNHRSRLCSNKENHQLLQEAPGYSNVGARDDSVCVDYYCKHCGYNTLRTPHLFDHFWKHAPIDLEFEHYAAVTAKPDNFRDGFPFLDALMRTHCTFAGFHGYPRPWLEQYPYFTEYCANRLGYWYFLPGLLLPTLRANKGNQIEMMIENRGFAPCYWEYQGKIRLTDTTGKETILPLPSLDNRAWNPGTVSVEKLELDLTGIAPGDYLFSFGLFEKEQPISLAISSRYRDKDGFYRLAKAVVE